MYGDNVTFLQAAIVCVFSLAVVFAVLFAISYIIDLVAWFLKKQEKASAPAPAPAPVPTPAPAPDPAPAQQGQLDVVLITAAVAAYLGKRSDEIVVRSIRRVGAEETAWSRSGRLDSMES